MKIQIKAELGFAASSVQHSLQNVHRRYQTLKASAIGDTPKNLGKSSCQIDEI
jgi:hypothetical protein